MTEKDLQITQELWSENAGLEKQAEMKYINWLHHPYIHQEYINRRISGSPEDNWVEYTKKRYVPEKLGLGLSLGCGGGGLERHALAAGICEKFEAFDVAEGAIKVAQAAAAEMGFEQRVNYTTCDINSIHLEVGRYDIVFASSSVHHFKELEHIFRQVKRALKPSGFFVMDEFVGPSQFQWTERQLLLSNQILEILPNKYKERYSLPGEPKNCVTKPSLEQMNAVDPSEAIRSADIIPLLSNYFHIVERVDYGGTLLHNLLDDIVGNFQPDVEEDMAFLKFICLMEDTLIKNKVISSDFAFLVAQNINLPT